MTTPVTLASQILTLLFSVADYIISPRDVKKRCVCILNYHRILVSPDPLIEGDPDVQEFHWQMRLLAENFNVIPLQKAVQAIAKNGDLPPRAICITFDDGYRSLHDLALPILKKYKLPATVFVTSGHIDENNMWNDRIIEAIRCMPNGTLDLRKLSMKTWQINSDKDRKRAAQEITKAVKYLPTSSRQETVREIETLAGTDGRSLMLTRKMIATLADNGIEIGAHTITHPILKNLDNQNACNEIFESKRQLEAVIAKPVNFFAYPNGKAGVDFDERHTKMAKDAGYIAAFASSSGPAMHGNDLYQIPRCFPWDSNRFMFGLRLLRWLANNDRKAP
ncbi:MAG TPA: polysaccharide deacetylase [Oxalobacteraceae bacterium]|nr:polysaccharide deacetylase [Oxalobacteraceae bacterium]